MSDLATTRNRVKYLTGDIAGIRVYVWYSCPVDNTEMTFGMTPLDMAILMGDVESTAQLLAAGADPDHLLKLFALTDLYDVTVVHPDRKKTRELLDDDDKVRRLFAFICAVNLSNAVTLGGAPSGSYVN